MCVRALGLASRPVKYLDHAVGRIAGHRAVLIDVRTPMNLIVLQPVWSRLREDTRIHLWFTAEDMRGVGAVLREEGLDAALLGRDAVRWRRFDLSLSADAWNHAPLTRCRSR